MIFLKPIAFTKYEDDGNLRDYYLWTDNYGWKHRDHLMVAGANPLEAEYYPDIPPPNDYTTPEEIAYGNRKK